MSVLPSIFIVSYSSIYVSTTSRVANSGNSLPAVAPADVMVFSEGEGVQTDSDTTTALLAIASAPVPPANKGMQEDPPSSAVAPSSQAVPQESRSSTVVSSVSAVVTLSEPYVHSHSYAG